MIQLDSRLTRSSLSLVVAAAYVPRAGADAELVTDADVDVETTELNSRHMSTAALTGGGNMS